MAAQTVEFGVLESDVVGFTENQRLAEELFVGLSIVSEGTIEYKNLLWPRYQNLYGKCQLMSGVYVVKNIPIQHINQELHWFRHPEIGILETIGCYFKAYGSADTPPVGIITNTTLVRDRITSIRFRLRPGVLANITIKWLEFTPKCGGNLVPPEADQGKPPGGSNGGYNPGNRPGAQGGDPEDNSPNDGLDKLPGQNDPPKPSGPGASASWKVQIQYFSNPPNCTPTSSIEETGVTDPNAKVTALSEETTPREPACGSAVKRLRVFSNGAELGGFANTRAPGIAVVGISYY